MLRSFLLLSLVVEIEVRNKEQAVSVSSQFQNRLRVVNLEIIAISLHFTSRTGNCENVDFRDRTRDKASARKKKSLILHNVREIVFILRVHSTCEYLKSN